MEDLEVALDMEMITPEQFNEAITQLNGGNKMKSLIPMKDYLCGKEKVKNIMKAGANEHYQHPAGIIRRGGDANK